MAARHEELVIAETIASAKVLILTSNLHVVSDGSTGATSLIAEAEGVNCLELHPNRGKASAHAAGIGYYALASIYEGMLLLDADTRLMPDYVKTKLPRFAASDVVAVAGRAKSLPAADAGNQWVGFCSHAGSALNSITQRDRE
ncbi:glycosyltransferase [Arthrobacter sunyaminii]|uniref:glycosyltransferase n=1 Tax=Arthrobacter sunyaminii TaxID=2816859 RepID=UPI0023548A49|nr:glycosyltransferase [Arthrobacter sunyaminii]